MNTSVRTIPGAFIAWMAFVAGAPGPAAATGCLDYDLQHIVPLGQLDSVSNSQMGRIVHDGGAFVYAVVRDDGLRTYTVDGNSVTLSTVVNLGGTYDLAISDAWLYAATVGGLRILDRTDGSNPVVVGSYAPPTTAVDVVGSLAFATTEQDLDLRILDVTDPASPREIGTVDIPSIGRTVQVQSSTACCPTVCS